jgi:hypothetical protein
MKSKNRLRRMNLWLYIIPSLISIALALSVLISAPVMSRIFNWVACRNAFEPTYTAEELWADPLPLPDVITNVPTHVSLSDYYQQPRPRIEIDDNVLWEPSPLDEYLVLQETTCITVNGRPILSLSFSQLLSSTFRLQPDGTYDEQGIGTEILPNFSHLEPGLHVATIRFEFITGTEYTHQWAFEVTR